ncbi:hypothetical protein GCM10025857_29440 [Alicyclobacillus contaminans]|uniref:hypothetical protein n=1 Tax=Alicyclobacillus contaminans TaxID=392016 RepID=UPI00041165E8|nr:hypothetical protein [Alicyclobacillus contaminans]GMA51587.1 hypothetical protein GCM10025857_29440 [Alicyclobacillus contaminans]
MGIIAGNMAMHITMLVVLALIGLNILVQVYTSLRGSADLTQLSNAFTQPVLYDVFPLILLSLLSTLDPSHFLVLIWYYAAAVLVAIKTMLQLARVLR